ncbi:hypothetical protein NKY66_10960 [Sinorhizobium meliloti]|uniref:hypothetical protein n=1 Tax=Rhizobium meliloti TaxID=382 RepID=UPI003D661F61
MGDRQLTNILLAVVAAVLLFGSSAVTGALKWTFITGAALLANRADIIPALRYGLYLLIRSPLAPIFLSIYGWRKARIAGDGVVSSTASAFVGLFFGLIVWAILVGMFAPLLGW